jgi:hypothetical protein
LVGKKIKPKFVRQKKNTMAEQIIFTNIASVDGVYMNDDSTDVHIVCNDFTGRNHVLVLHPAHVFKIKQLMMDAIVGPEEEAQDGN